MSENDNEFIRGDVLNFLFESIDFYYKYKNSRWFRFKLRLKSIFRRR